MVVLDSNIWIAYLDQKDERHEKAEEMYDQLDDDIIFPEYIYLEVGSFLIRRKKEASFALFAEIAEQNVDIQLLPSSPEFFYEVRKKFRHLQSHRLSFVDVSLLVLSRSYTVMTFDQTVYKLLKKE